MSGNTQHEKDLQWFVKAFAAASQLESRLIPDVLDSKEHSVRKADFHIPVTRKHMDGLCKGSGYPEDVLVETAFALTLSVWSADTKACFHSVLGDGPERPVFVEWAPGHNLGDILEKVSKQKDGALKHCSCTFGEVAAELELDRSVCLSGAFCPESSELPEGTDVLFCWGTDSVTVLYRSEHYSEDILRQFTDSLSACILSMEKAENAKDLAFATDRQLEEVEGFNPPPVGFVL